MTSILNDCQAVADTDKFVVGGDIMDPDSAISSSGCSSDNRNRRDSDLSVTFDAAEHFLTFPPDELNYDLANDITFASSNNNLVTTTTTNLEDLTITPTGPPNAQSGLIGDCLKADSPVPPPFNGNGLNSQTIRELSSRLGLLSCGFSAASTPNFQAPPPLTDHPQSDQSNACLLCKTGTGGAACLKILSCFHHYCTRCLEKLAGGGVGGGVGVSCAMISCPMCQQVTYLPAKGGVAGLMSKASWTDLATQTTSQNNVIVAPSAPSASSCYKHKSEPLRYFCKSCAVPVCQDCTLVDHAGPFHDCVALERQQPEQASVSAAKFNSKLAGLIEMIRAKLFEHELHLRTSDKSAQRLQAQFIQAKRDVSDFSISLHNAVDARKCEVLRDLETAFTGKQVKISYASQKLRDFLQKSTHSLQILEQLTKSELDVALIKNVIESRIACIFNFSPPDIAAWSREDLEFASPPNNVNQLVRSVFGHIKGAGSGLLPDCNDKVKCDEQGKILTQGGGGSNIFSTDGLTKAPGDSYDTWSSAMTNADANFKMAAASSISNLGNFLTNGNGLDSNGSAGKEDENYNSNVGVNPFATCLNSNHQFGLSKINNFMNSLANATVDDMYWPNPNGHNASTVALPVPLHSKANIKRRKMIYHCKFGEFGLIEGQFTEPSGVAVNAQGDIIVADTNNHRIQIFDRDGRFKFQFGECGKRDGQLLYPNRVAAVRASGDIVVTERSPTHQIQIFNQYGQFLRKFGADVLQHPRGVAVDPEGRVIIVECKVMRVVIFDHVTGEVLYKFGCSKHLEFPNGLAVNDRAEIFISDNRAHCVKVFDYNGTYLRQIGGPGVTNYPIGVGIEPSTGRLLVADNHNNFNLTVFDQQGTLLDSLESKVKHAQCFDVALLDDDSVVLASKDFRIYVYRYNNNTTAATGSSSGTGLSLGSARSSLSGGSPPSLQTGMYPPPPNNNGGGGNGLLSNYANRYPKLGESPSSYLQQQQQPEGISSNWKQSLLQVLEPASSYGSESMNYNNHLHQQQHQPPPANNNLFSGYASDFPRPFNGHDASNQQLKDQPLEGGMMFNSSNGIHNGNSNNAGLGSVGSSTLSYYNGTTGSFANDDYNRFWTAGPTSYASFGKADQGSDYFNGFGVDCADKSKQPYKALYNGN